MRKRKVGTVISDKPNKTIIVGMSTYVKHPRYKKYVRRSTTVYVHDEKNECQVGDRVMIEETRPLSKLKRWRVVRRMA